MPAAASTTAVTVPSECGSHLGSEPLRLSTEDALKFGELLVDPVGPCVRETGVCGRRGSSWATSTKSETDAARSSSSSRD